jgi:hypothetical protein
MSSRIRVVQDRLFERFVSFELITECLGSVGAPVIFDILNLPTFRGDLDLILSRGRLRS